MRGFLYWKEQPEDEGRISATDASLRPILKTTFKSYIGIIGIYLIVHWLAASMYYGPNFTRTNHINKTDIKIIDLDGGYVGGNLTQLLLKTAEQPEQPAWVVHHGISSIEEAKDYVQKKGWGAVVIHPGLTERFTDALTKGAEYNPKDAMTTIVSTGRGPMGTLLFTQPSLAKVTLKAASVFSVSTVVQFKQMVKAGLIKPGSNLNLNTLLHPIQVNSVEVSPCFYELAPVATAFMYFVTIACIVGPMIGWKMKSFESFSTVRFSDLYLLWAGKIYLWLFLFSLYASFAFLAFKGPLYGTSIASLPYTVSNFFTIWFSTYASVLAPALWIFSIFTVVPPIFVGATSLLTIIPNMASTLLPIEMMPKIFRFYYALPFFNGSMLFRTITSGAFPHVARNIGILVADVAFSTVLLLACVWFRQYCILNGISDIIGNYRGNPFFNSPIPYYKDRSDAKSDIEKANLVDRNSDDDYDDSDTKKEERV
ncbi:hypothetical protein GGI12_002687 [Dipsacomyces acuminosporus]|nr:hypothetical protein GGI12_002687 [Dipsacomyces acuminosporus]